MNDTRLIRAGKNVDRLFFFGMSRMALGKRNKIKQVESKLTVGR